MHNHVKKEGWLKFAGVDNERCEDATRKGVALSLKSHENIATVIDTYALTGNKAMACEQVGIDDKTL